MFEQLEEYTSKDHFFFTKDDDLEKVCNAPKNGMGIYLVYMLKNGKIELVYIGASGKALQNGTAKIRAGGMFDRLVNGKQFDKARKTSWKEKLKAEGVDALDVYWYETFNKEFGDIPATVKAITLQQHFEMFGKLPLWNVEL